MDDFDRELVIDLATKIGMVMEDVSPIALTLGTLSVEDLDRDIDAIIRAAREIGAFAHAIEAIGE